VALLWAWNEAICFVNVTERNKISMRTIAAAVFSWLKDSCRIFLVPVTIAAVLAGTVAQAAVGPFPDRPGLENLFKRLDTNNDLNLSRQEFDGLARVLPRFRDNPDRIEALFKQLDANSDGSMLMDEFRKFGQLGASAQGLLPGQRNRRIEANSKPDQPAPTSIASRSVAAEKPPTPEELSFFEKKIRPVLADKCYKCHAADAEKVKGGLLLDTREGIRKGGDSGHAIVPGQLRASLLLKAIHYEDEDLAMPPKKEGGKLPAEVIADFEKWVLMGAPDPRDGKAVAAKQGIDIEKGREHWAFQAPKKIAPAKVNDAKWAWSDLDRFILAELQAKGLKPVHDADKATLLRRIHFDLIGLPPTPEEVDAFVKDISPRAFEKVVDTLLASPQFGERWGRHWLDVARYAESSGKEVNIAYPHAWRYRDYVIKSFNDDKPYDRFLKEQLAGDRLPATNDTQRAEQLTATGFLALGPKSHNTQNQRQFALDLADEQIDALSQGMLGLTVACARCHDHKFDPVPQADYYALAGIFLSTETDFGTPRFVQNRNVSPLIPLPEGADVPDAPALAPQQLAALKRQLDQAQKTREELLAEARSQNQRPMGGNPRLQGANTQIAILEKQLGRHDENGKPSRLAMGAGDRLYPRDAQVLGRGEIDKPGQTVPRGFLQVLATEPTKIKEGSGRLELANWIASPENPLTARVMANRVWLNLFDRGLVPTPDNFGTTGQKPSHPELLDHLAISFVENGWSVKKLIRQIVLSHAYQIGSDYDARNYAADPDNVYHWRMSKRRLDAEAIRDAMLAVAGKLDLTPPQGSPGVASAEGLVLRLLRPPPGLRGGRFGGPPGAAGGGGLLSSDSPNRSVYLPIIRDQVPDALAVFDFAESSLVVGDREDTTVPSQALYLMNSITAQKLAEAMAGRLLARDLKSVELYKAAFQLAFARSPTDGELKATGEFFKRFNAAESNKYSNQEQLERAGATAFCQALLGSAEFRYLN
jgi:hypothetical protein